MVRLYCSLTFPAGTLSSKSILGSTCRLPAMGPADRRTTSVGVVIPGADPHRDPSDSNERTLPSCPPNPRHAVLFSDALGRGSPQPDQAQRFHGVRLLEGPFWTGRWSSGTVTMYSSIQLFAICRMRFKRDRLATQEAPPTVFPWTRPFIRQFEWPFLRLAQSNGVEYLYDVPLNDPNVGYATPVSGEYSAATATFVCRVSATM